MTYYQGHDPFLFISISLRFTGLMMAAGTPLIENGYRVFANNSGNPNYWESIVTDRLCTPHCVAVLAIVNDAFLTDRRCHAELSLAAIHQKPVAALILTEKPLPYEIETLLANAVRFPCTIDTIRDTVLEKVAPLDILQPCLERSSFVIKDSTLTRYRGSYPKVTIPDTVTDIYFRAFSQNASLKTVIFPKGLKTIGQSVFENCFGIEEIILPEGLETIGKYAFFNCDKLEKIYLPESLLSLGDGVFAYCYQLQTVRVPKRIKQLPPSLFRQCLMLKEIILPEGLETIGENAFESCHCLQSVRIPDSVKTIGERAFSDCIALETVYLSQNTVYRENSFPEGAKLVFC